MTTETTLKHKHLAAATHYNKTWRLHFPNDYDYNTEFLNLDDDERRDETASTMSLTPMNYLVDRNNPMLLHITPKDR